jgi:aldehyde:ferredoxin oxidoreductase
MTNGFTGKILRVNLTTKAISTIDTAKYEEFGGGYGIGTALFWDLAVAPGEWDLQDAYDPRNVLAIMSGTLAATGVPAAGRTSVSGVSPEVFPTNSFSRTNFGGRFGTMLKLAGWDGIVLEGKADKPVWINIIDDKVTLEDAKALWGLNTYETQDRITAMVGGRTRFGDEWQQIGDAYTTARPQIVCIGPVGEARARIAALIHGSGISARTGGYGGVFGAKNLKAISVTGTGSIRAADPKGVVDARLWHSQNFSRMRPVNAGSAACMVCLNNDRKRNSYYGGESMCTDTLWFFGKSQDIQMKGAETIMKWGISAWGGRFEGVFKVDVPGAPALFKKQVPIEPGLGWYIKYLYELGVLGPGKKIDSYPLPMDQWDELSFREIMCDAISRRIGIGDALAEGTLEAAKKWGRLEEDLNSGALRFPAWGSLYHWTLPAVEWAYGYLLGAGDPTWHGFFFVLGPGSAKSGPPAYTVEQLVEMMSTKVIPYTGDPLMFSYAWKGEEARATGIYSAHKAKQIAWTRHYAGFWNESMAFCETEMPSFVKRGSADFSGPTPEIEMRYYQAVTGKKESFADTMETGRKIWNLERAIRVAQGRHRDQEKFAPFMYMPGASFSTISGGIPVYENGKWSWQALLDLYLDDAGVELFKTRYYQLEGWDINTGWPARKTLEGLGLKRVADTLAKRAKLGA